MTYEEINNFIPHRRSLARARRTSWPDVVFIQREGGWSLFDTVFLPEGGFKHEAYYEGFCKVHEGDDVIGGRCAHVNWKPNQEDLVADDWVLL